MNSTAKAPGLYFTAVPRTVEPSPLRSDVAGFIGQTRRGPIGVPVRVEGLRGFLSNFGGLSKNAVMTYAIQGYFENEGQVAHVIRICHPSITKASAQWEIKGIDANGEMGKNFPAAFTYSAYRIEATSPGDWANNTKVTISYRLRGSSGKPEIDVGVQTPQEPCEYFVGLSPYNLAEEIAIRSALIRLIPESAPLQNCLLRPGPQYKQWTCNLGGAKKVDEENKPGKQEYLDAIRWLGEEAEVAIVAVPGLYEDLNNKADQNEILSLLIEQAEQFRDRLVLIDVPKLQDIESVLRWIDKLRSVTNENSTRAAAVYHPWLKVRDPLGGIWQPVRNIPPSGHIAGVLSRMDRERGAHYTPANTPIFEVVDVTQGFNKEEQVNLNSSGINLLRCFPGNGLQVWGGRTLNLERDKRFIAHRRLIHRLVRAIRRVAEPLVFDINGPELRLAVVRSITTVLLESWRAGALKGERPEEAFRVFCDEQNNPPEDVELGLVQCAIEIAPAVPMEFILLRVSLSGDGKLDVFES